VAERKARRLSKGPLLLHASATEILTSQVKSS